MRTRKLAVLNAKQREETDWEQELSRLRWEETKNLKEKTKDLELLGGRVLEGSPTNQKRKKH